MAYAQSGGERSSAGQGFLNDDVRPVNVYVWTRTLVLKVLWEGTHAIGVQVREGDKGQGGNIHRLS